MRKKVLLVEDNIVDLNVVGRIFSNSDILEAAQNYKEADTKLSDKNYDLLLLDIGLPDGSGLNLVAKYHEKLKVNQTSVFVLSSYHEEINKIMAFQLDVDEYITKPFSPLELRARLDSHFRKKEEKEINRNTKVIGNLIINLTAQTAVIRDQTQTHELILTPLEFKMLVFFSNFYEQIKTRNQIIDGVWGDSINVIDRVVDTHICRLRKKLHNCDCNIVSVLNAGYIMKKVT